MTKKHFIALADKVMSELCGFTMTYDPSRMLSSERVIAALADFCAEQNPRFNRDLWLSYIKGECGPNGGKVKVTK